MQLKGIDVSHYQGDIDFEQVKNSGIEFVIIKAGEWDQTDEKFEENYEKAKAAGLHIGFYWYCDGETLAEISAEADACIKALEGKQFDFPIYMDMENSYQYNLGKTFCSDAVRTFCGKLEDAGYFAGLYTSTSWLFGVIDDDVKQKYTIWVADWRGYCGYEGDYDMWQYGAGYVPGINGKTDLNIVDWGCDTDYPGNIDGDVDLDYAYKDFSEIIISGGFNNYPKPETSSWNEDPCREVGDSLSISGAVPILSGERWFLIDKSCSFTLETLPYAKVNVYLVGGGDDGAEWEGSVSDQQSVAYIDNGGRGACVVKKELYITGNVECSAVIAERNNPTGTTLKVGNDIHKCTDEGYIRRKATASGENMSGGGIFNAEHGANGIETPYGYVGSSGGGGGSTAIRNSQHIEVFPGKGGVGAGDGGAVRNNGSDAVNYGCGGGAAGFCGYYSDGDVVETHAGKGMKGCIIFEILDGGACDGSPNKPSVDNADNCNCNRSCGCGHHEFACSDPSESSSECTQEKTYSLTYDGDTPVIVESTNTASDTDTENHSENSGNSSTANTVVSNNSGASSNCGCNSSGNSYSGGHSCSCGGHSGKSKYVSYDVQKWGENWLLFDESGEYSLNMDEDVTFKIYLVGGGSDGKDGLYYNRTAYGGDGGRGGCYNVVSDVFVSKGQTYITVRIGERGATNGTSVVINNNEYCCNGIGCIVNDGGYQGISGKYDFRNAGNGANGIETPFGFIGSSGGGGAAYCNSQTSGHGRGGAYGGNGGKIVNGRSSPGDNAVGYGCGGGGGSATPASWCKGGKGKRGCVIITW
ncbi:MAG: hypothetical protein HDT44_01210 [Ruminococcaceae bacterium]|nr:hypothetical protein [Oscillospiraceae bacterium]